MADGIEPRLPIETSRLDYQRVAIPLADGSSHPGGPELLGKSPAVGGDHVKNVPGLVQHGYAIRGLKNLDGEGRVHRSSQALRQAVTGVIELADVVCLEIVLAPRSEGQRS